MARAGIGQSTRLCDTQVILLEVARAGDCRHRGSD